MPSGRPEVIDALRAMRAVERPDGFQFDEDGVFDQEIYEIFTHQGAFVGDRDSALLFDGETGHAQLHRQRIFVHLFQLIMKMFPFFFFKFLISIILLNELHGLDIY